mgnify:CR=1 FL=1
MAGAAKDRLHEPAQARRFFDDQHAQRRDVPQFAVIQGEFGELDWNAAAARMARPLLVDGRNYLDPEVLVAAGFEYEGIGKAPALPAAAASE